MARKLFTLCSIVLLSAAASTVSSATTLTYKSSDNGIYPYNMSVNSSNTQIAMDCLNDTRFVTTNEKWNVTEINLLGLTGTVDGGKTTALELDEQAWLDSLYGTNFTTAAGKASNTDIQDAIWDIQDSADTSGLSQVEKDLVADAGTFVGTHSASSIFFAQFEVFIPTSNTSGWTRGEPQEFIQFTPKVTPEPSSLMLLGTGILGAAVMFRRKIAAKTRS